MEKFKIKFRPVRKSDIKLRAKWLNNPAINQGLSWHYREVGTTLKEQKEWYERYSKDKYDKRFIIVANNKPVGIVGLTEISPVDRNGMLYLFIGENGYRGQGIGTAALKFIFDYGFNKLKLHKIGLMANSYNTRAIKLYKSLGFQYEGAQKEQIFYNTKYYDLVYMGLIKN